MCKYNQVEEHKVHERPTTDVIKVTHKTLTGCDITNINVNNTNTNTIINNNNIHVTINNCRDVDASHIDNAKLVKLIEKIRCEERYFHIFQQLVDLIYFDAQHPQNHSISVSNIRNKLTKVMNKNKLQFADKAIVTGNVINKTRNTLHDTYDDNMSQYSLMVKQTMQNMDNKYDNDDKTFN